MKDVASIAEVRRLRRASLINLTLTDLLIMVLFVLLLFTFRASEEGRDEVSGLEAELRQVRVERDKLRDELAIAQVALAKANARVQELEESVRRLLASLKDSLNPDPVVAFEKLQAENRQLQARVESLEKILRAQQREIADKNRVLTQQGRGTGFPKCLVTEGFLLEVQLLESGNLSIKPSWDAGAEATARAVPGVRELVEAGEVTQDAFRQHAGRILAWGDEQEVRCRFHVNTATADPAPSLETYRRQMNVIERHFYARRG